MNARPTHWDEFFFRLCDVNASMSHDPSTKVGAVIVRPNKTVVSMGWNGFPRGCDDRPDLYTDRQTKYARVVHAEVNAVLMAREDVARCTLYVSPLHPCSTCAGIIIQAGIQRVIARIKGDPEQWEQNFAEARRMFREAGVSVITYPPE